jgi:hypothetical protein
LYKKLCREKTEKDANKSKVLGAGSQLNITDVFVSEIEFLIQYKNEV